MIDSIKNFLKVEHDHASIVSFVHVKSDFSVRCVKHESVEYEFLNPDW